MVWYVIVYGRNVTEATKYVADIYSVNFFIFRQVHFLSCGWLLNGGNLYNDL